MSPADPEESRANRNCDHFYVLLVLIGYKGPVVIRRVRLLLTFEKNLHTKEHGNCKIFNIPRNVNLLGDLLCFVEGDSSFKC